MYAYIIKCIYYLKITLIIKSVLQNHWYFVKLSICLQKIRLVMIKTFYFIIFIIFIVSCNPENTSFREQLAKWEAMQNDAPKAVLDSLEKIDANRLNKSDQARYYLLRASATDKNFTYHTTDSTLRIAEAQFLANNDFYNLARTQYYIAKYLSNQKKKEAAYDLLKQAELNFSKGDQEDPHFMGLLYYLLYRIQDEQGNVAEAQEYTEKSLDKFLEARDTISAVYSLKQLGLIYIDREEYAKAKEYLLEGEKLISTSSKQNSPKVSAAKSSIYLIFSILYRNISDLPNALKYAKESIEVCQQTNSKIIPAQYHSLIIVFKAQNQTDSVRYYCQKIISAAQEQKSTFNLMNGYKLLYELEEEQGNYKEACLLREKFNECKDEYNTKNRSDSFVELEKKYNIAEKERLILKAENTKLQLFVIFFVIICLAITAGVRFHYRHKKLKAKFAELSEEVKHTEWGFSVTKELITENHNYYDEMEKLLNRYRMSSINSEMYNKFQEVFKAQKASYSARLFSTLTNFDGVFVKKFQKKFPTLSPDDIMIAAMIRHQWTNTDISAVFHATTEAIRKRKSRLGNKISLLLKKDIVLEEFLSKM